MPRKFARAIVFAATVVCASPTLACSIAPPEPPLAGESDAVYRARMAEKQRQQAELWHRQRLDDVLQRADTIFIARAVEWSPPVPRALPTPRSRRRGRLVPPVPRIPLPVFEYPASSYFKPIAWYRGTRPTGVFKVKGSETTCGPMSLGDTLGSVPGELFVFYATKGRISERTLIDAIAIDRIDGPALQDFVAKHHATTKANAPAVD